MKKTASIIFRSAILIFIGIVLGVFISRDDIAPDLPGFSFKRADKMSKVLQLVQYNYVDSVNVDSIEGATVNELLQKLDPHSLYLPPQQATAVNERLEGGFTGLGIEYRLLRDTFIITQVYPGSPAAKAGLMGGAKVLSVNNQKFSGTGLTETAIDKVLKGDNKNQPFYFAALIPGDYTAKKQFILKPGHVTLSSLDASYIAANDIGYIKISKFASTTDADFRKALSDLKVLGMKKLVLDLRGNGGGYLNTATALADEFLSKGKLIVYTKGVHEPRTDYFATDSGEFEKGNLAILIDEYSASASEILAGALQDLDRAVIVGRRSFGKGLVQQQFPFDDGSAINLTVARYYTPSGRSIQKSYSGGVQSYRNELTERMRKGELFSAESNLNDSIFSKQSPYRTSRGKKVFSGGGIMPDIFIPADSAQNTLLVRQLSEKQLFGDYVIDKMQTLLQGYGPGEKFITDYQVNDDTLIDFIQYAAPFIKELTPQDIRISKEEIRNLLKANAARFKWGDTYYFQALNSNDETLNKAIAAVQ